MLTLKQKRLVPVAAFATEGNIDGLRNALAQALDDKVAINDIKEVLVQTYAYAGFPRSLNALSALMDVVNKRHNAGKKDEQGRDASPVHTDKTMLEVGSGIQTKLVGQPVTGPLFEFAPAIDQFLKSHLFGDIFVRDNLDYETREVATIAMLAALQGAQSQLKSHYQMGTNTGLEKKICRKLLPFLNRRSVRKLENVQAKCLIVS